GVGLEATAAEVDAFARRPDGDSMIAHRAADNHHVAGSGVRRGDGYPIGNEPDTGGGDEEFVGATAVDHLRVAGYDGDTSLRSGLRHRLRDPLEILQRQTLL